MSSLFENLAKSAKKALFESGPKKVIIHWEAMTVTGFPKKGSLVMEEASFDLKSSVTPLRQAVDRIEKQRNPGADKLLGESFKVTGWRPAVFEDFHR